LAQINIKNFCNDLEKNLITTDALLDERIKYFGHIISTNYQLINIKANKILFIKTFINSVYIVDLPFYADGKICIITAISMYVEFFIDNMYDELYDWVKIQNGIYIISPIIKMLLSIKNLTMKQKLQLYISGYNVAPDNKTYIVDRYRCFIFMKIYNLDLLIENFYFKAHDCKYPYCTEHTKLIIKNNKKYTHELYTLELLEYVKIMRIAIFDASLEKHITFEHLKEQYSEYGFFWVPKGSKYNLFNYL
jgi:hypothetical protein